MRQPAPREDVPVVLVLMVMSAAGVGYWLFTTPAAEREALLGSLGYGPPPGTLMGQLEWLLHNRLTELTGMVALLGLAAACGVVEGHARWQSSSLSGFGLRLLALGRVLLVVWGVGLLAVAVIPTAWPYEGVAVGLAVLLGVALYALVRGRSRAH